MKKKEPPAKTCPRDPTKKKPKKEDLTAKTIRLVMRRVRHERRRRSVDQPQINRDVISQMPMQRWTEIPSQTITEASQEDPRTSQEDPRTSQARV
jgi:hypothetical protein